MPCIMRFQIWNIYLKCTLFILKGTLGFGKKKKASIEKKPRFHLEVKILSILYTYTYSCSCCNYNIGAFYYDIQSFFSSVLEERELKGIYVVWFSLKSIFRNTLFGSCIGVEVSYFTFWEVFQVRFTAKKILNK